jgi:hypothetical protein
MAKHAAADTHRPERFMQEDGQRENRQAGIKTVADSVPHTEPVSKEYRAFLACFEA